MAVLLYLLLSFPFPTHSGFFNGMLQFFEVEEMNSSSLLRESYLYLEIQPQLAFFSGFLDTDIPGFLRYNCTHSRSGILSSDALHPSGGVIIFVT